MTNPNNAIGTNGAYGGRTSVNAFNDDLNFYTRGTVSGWDAVPKSGMTIQIGGVAGYRDVAVAQDNAGNKTSINNISGNPVEVTIDTAPSTNSRIDVVVAYVDNPPQGDSSTVDNPGSCGIIVVKGTASSSPVVPNDSAIRTAITGDGASGATAYYVILAQVTVGTNVTVISAAAITGGPRATMSGSHITPKTVNNTQLGDNAVSTDNIQNGAVTSPKIDFTTLINQPAPGTEVQSLSITTDNSTYTPTTDGRLVGIFTVNGGAEGFSFVQTATIYIGGIIHMPSLSSATQIVANIPVKANQQLTFRVSGGNFSGAFYSTDFS